MTRDELAAWWRFFGETECAGYSALYEAVTAAVADAPEALDLLLALPPSAHQPTVLLAAVHERVLKGLEPALAQHYDERIVEGVGRSFVEVVRRAWDELAPVVASRHTQTNEIGRVAFIAPALAALDLSPTTTLLDVGASAGLTLTIEHCHIDYGAHGSIGPADSTVQVACDVLHGTPTIRPVAVAARLGLDRNPLDARSPADATWLLACTWPDTDRLERTRAALELAAAHPSVVHRGDAIDDLPALLQDITGPVVVTTTWVMGYLSPEQRGRFAQHLAEASRERRVAWVSAEAPGIVAALPHVAAPAVEGTSASVLAAIDHADGAPTSARVLAHVHPHGRWLWWYD